MVLTNAMGLSDSQLGVGNTIAEMPFTNGVTQVSGLAQSMHSVGLDWLSAAFGLATHQDLASLGSGAPKNAESPSQTLPQTPSHASPLKQLASQNPRDE
jgi:hypothetical protein